MPTRLGVVSYLNTRPLVDALESCAFPHSFELFYDVPSQCADNLREGNADLSLIPSIEIARGPDPFLIVPGVSISSFGPVQSVLLITKRDPEDIRTLALDESSRTAATLVRILLERRFGCRPIATQSTSSLQEMLSKADAALLIGDPALDLDASEYRVIDLGRVWSEMTGLPFVYACWTGRAGALKPGEGRKLVRSKEIGLQKIPQIARDFAGVHEHDASFYENYLTSSICFDLGDREIDAMIRFFRYALELGLADHVPSVRFFPSL